MATEAVYKYLKNQNRPYSANDVTQNLHKEYGKTAIQKALDQLVSDGKIQEKTYGKQKVYCVMQDKDCDPEQMNKEIQEMDKKCEEICEELKTTTDEYKNCEEELKKLVGSLTTEEAKEKKDEMEANIEKMEKKLNDLKSNNIFISAEEKDKTFKDHEKYLKEYRKRKRMCMDVINAVLEGYPKSKKDLLEEIGLETDEDVGFSIG